MAENMVNMVILLMKDSSIFLNTLITSYQKTKVQLLLINKTQPIK